MACVSLQCKGWADQRIADVADRLTAKGLWLAGTGQSNHERPNSKECDMDLRVLPDGPFVRISEAEGKGLGPVIAEALHRGLPVCVEKNGLNPAALLSLAETEIPGLPTHAARVAEWCLAGVVRLAA
jgi:hypothetical protein